MVEWHSKKQIERKTITSHEIRSVQTSIETEGQTCFSVFAGLRVLYLNLNLVFPVGSLLAGAGGCSTSEARVLWDIQYRSNVI